LRIKTDHYTKYGFTNEEYNSCVKVLSKFVSNPNVLKGIEFKQLRTLGSSIFVDGFGQEFYGGVGQSKYKKKRDAKLEASRKEYMKKANDKKFINSRQLRFERIEKLNKLIEQAPLEVPLLTDASELEKFKEEKEKEKEIQTEENKLNSHLGELHNPRSCYICKSRFFKLHHFYDNMCPSCADLSYTKRFQGADLTGYVSIITGARIKIGYQCALKLLRCGSTVVVTTRFPNDAALRFAKEDDFNKWQDRIHVVGLDLRNLKSVEEFVDLMYTKFDRLDILVNNASQTVRKPPAFYSHLMPTEMKSSKELGETIVPLLQLHETGLSKSIENRHSMTQDKLTYAGISSPEISAKNEAPRVINPTAILSQVPLMKGDEHYDEQSFPKGILDMNNQQLDLRRTNSWLTKLEEVATIELVEVTSINQLSPFILCSKLKQLMLKSPAKDKFVINVSAMEGKFYRHKTSNHPHTNMAKAGLNMLTRTSAQDYADSRIWMNAVDTGWVTDENPFEKATGHAQRANFICPLDEVEAMARILDPIFSSLETGQFDFGMFYKDYHETEW